MPNFETVKEVSQKTAFGNLFDRYFPALKYFAQGYVKDKGDAEELVHDTFMAIWEKREQLTFDASLKPYLYKALRNKCLNFARKQKLEIQEVGENFEPTGNIPDPLQDLTKKETEQRIFAAIEKLPPRCRQIFLLSRTENLSYKEIAEVMELSSKTVENQIAIALKSIRKSLGMQENGNNGNVFLNILLLGILMDGQFYTRLLG